MGTVRVSVSLDEARDIALIERLAPLRETGGASAYVRNALAAALAAEQGTVAINDVGNTLQRLEAKLDEVLAAVRAGKLTLGGSEVNTVTPDVTADLEQAATNLSAMLARFRRNPQEQTEV